MSSRLECLVELDHAIVAQLKQNPDLVHDFASLFLLGQVLLIDALYRYHLPRQFVHAQGYFTEGASAKHLSSPVKVWSRVWCFAELIEGLNNDIRLLQDFNYARTR